MITYHYRCTCAYEFEVEQSIKDKPLVECPECHQNSLERVMHGGLAVFVDQGPQTLGQLAERNTKKFGKYKVEELEKDRPKSDGKVSYTDKEKRRKISKMNPKQIEKYIYEGK